MLRAACGEWRLCIGIVDRAARAGAAPAAPRARARPVHARALCTRAPSGRGDAATAVKERLHNSVDYSTRI